MYTTHVRPLCTRYWHFGGGLSTAKESTHRVGKQGLVSDLDGPYVLLAGVRAVMITGATLAFAAYHPFPNEKPTCG